MEETTVEKAKTKKFKNTDLVQCKSIVNGELLVVGQKTGSLYKWANYGYVTEMEYQDLLYEVRSATANVMSPRIIILDKDFVEQNKQLSEVYDAMYSVGDLKDLVRANLRTIKSNVNKLPNGAFESLKGIVATMITSGELDSITKIKYFDEIFETQMLQTLLEN